MAESLYSPMESRGMWKSDLARREVKSIWKGQIKLECHCHSHRDEIDLFCLNICHFCGCGSFNIYTAKIAQLKCLMTAFFQQRALYICSEWYRGAAAFEAETFFKMLNYCPSFPRFQEFCLSHFGTRKVLRLEVTVWGRKVVGFQEQKQMLGKCKA